MSIILHLTHNSIIIQKNNAYTPTFVWVYFSIVYFQQQALSTMNDASFLKNLIESTDFLSHATPKQVMAIKSCDSKHLYCSPYLLELMGADAHEVIGKTIWAPLYDHQADFEKTIIKEDKNFISSP